MWDSVYTSDFNMFQFWITFGLEQSDFEPPLYFESYSKLCSFSRFNSAKNTPSSSRWFTKFWSSRRSITNATRSSARALCKVEVLQSSTTHCCDCRAVARPNKQNSQHRQTLAPAVPVVNCSCRLKTSAKLGPYRDESRRMTGLNGTTACAESSWRCPRPRLWEPVGPWHRGTLSWRKICSTHRLCRAGRSWMLHNR